MTNNPYTVEHSDVGHRIVGPAITGKWYPHDCRERLQDLSAALNVAYVQGVLAQRSAIVEAYKK